MQIQGHWSCQVPECHWRLDSWAPAVKAAGFLRGAWGHWIRQALRWDCLDSWNLTRGLESQALPGSAWCTVSMVKSDAHFIIFLPLGGFYLGWAAWAWRGVIGMCSFIFPTFLNTSFSISYLHSGTAIPHLKSLALLTVFLCADSCSKLCFWGETNSRISYATMLPISCTFYFMLLDWLINISAVILLSDNSSEYFLNNI